MKLKTKLWLAILASTITGLFMFFGISWVSGNLFNNGYTHAELDMLGKGLVVEAEQTDSQPGQVQALFNRFTEKHPQLRLEWFSQDGTPLYASDGQTLAYDFDELMERFVNMPANLWTPGEDITLVYDWGNDNSQNYLIISLPSEAMQNTQLFFFVRDAVSLLQLMFPLIILLTIPYIFALFFFGRISRRLNKLNQAMNDFEAHSSMIKLEDKNKDEIGQLARHFNVMSERINRQVSQIQEFDNNRKTLIANISHDLRTPMTMIQGYAETIHAGMYQNEEERKKYTDIILRRSRYMDKLLQKLLEISQLDMSKDQIHLEKTNVSELLRRIAGDYVPVLENRGLEFDIEIPDESIHALIDTHLIERALRNLIENSIQYGSDGGYLGLVLEVNDNKVEVSISDRGPGIPADQQELVFERFFRGSEGREGEGIGIGLSIVQEIASAHEGHVKLVSIPNEKTIFTFVLPKE